MSWGQGGLIRRHAQDRNVAIWGGVITVMNRYKEEEKKCAMRSREKNEVANEKKKERGEAVPITGENDVYRNIPAQRGRGTLS